jgi:hypothetical protein
MMNSAPPQKKLKKKAGRVTQVVEHLPTKCEAMSSNITMAKKKKKTLMKSQ